MKLTKQRLKEIIKEEVDRSSIRESDGDDWGYMPPRKAGASRQHQLGDIQTEPRFDTGRSPEQKLIDALAQRAAVDGMSAEDAAAAYGLEGDAEVIAYIQGLLGDKMLDNPRGVEETLKDDISNLKYRKASRPPGGRGTAADEKEKVARSSRRKAKLDIKKGKD